MGAGKGPKPNGTCAVSVFFYFHHSQYFRGTAPRKLIGPNGKSCRDSRFLSVLHRGNVNQRQLLGPVLQTGCQRVGRIQGGQDIDACLDGIAADDETVMAALRALGRNIDNQINLVAQHQVQDIGGFLLQLADFVSLYTVLVQCPRSASGGKYLIQSEPSDKVI